MPLIRSRCRFSARHLLVTAVVAVVFAAALMPVASAQVDPANDARVVELEAEYRVVPEEGRVEVVETIAIRNVRGNSGGYYYYWTGHDVWVPEDALGISITSNGREMEREELELLAGQRHFSVDFPSNLLFGQSRTVVVTYTLPTYGSAARAGERRINEAMFDIDFSTCCFFEEVTARVIVPRGFDVRSGIGFDREVVDGEQVFTFYADEIETGEFTEFVGGTWMGTNETGMDRRTANLGDGSALILAQPDDVAWGRDVNDRFESIGGSLQTLTGEQWEIDATFHQSDGRTMPSGRTEGTFDEPIRLRPSYERGLAIAMAYELTPDLPFAEQGHTEGLTYNLASMALDAEGIAYEPAPPGDDGIRTPNNWFWLSRQITDEIGLDAWLDLADMAASGQSVYPAEVPAEQPVDLPTDWRRIVDVAEFEIGTDEITNLLDRWLLDARERELLNSRNAALVGLAELREASAALGPDVAAPVGIRNAISAWEIDDANELMAAGSAMLDDIADSREVAAAANFRLDEDITAEWAAATSAVDFAAVSARFADRAAQATEIAQRQARLGAERGRIEDLGFDQPEAEALLGEANQAFADNDPDTITGALADFDAMADDAPIAGRNKALTYAIAPAILLLLVLAFVISRLRRRSRNREASAAAADAGKVQEIDLIAEDGASKSKRKASTRR